MTLMVSLDKPWLVDVGFGDLFHHPLRLVESTVQGQRQRAYRFAVDGEWWTLMERKPGENWKAQYRFTWQAYDYANFVPMCIYHQTSLESKFRRDLICSMATPEGRKTLSNMKYILTTLSRDRVERDMKDEQEFAHVLAEEFGITL